MREISGERKRERGPLGRMLWWMVVTTEVGGDEVEIEGSASPLNFDAKGVMRLI